MESRLTFDGSLRWKPATLSLRLKPDGSASAARPASHHSTGTYDELDANSQTDFSNQQAEPGPVLNLYILSHQSQPELSYSLSTVSKLSDGKAHSLS